MDQDSYDVAVVGAGMAGLSAAIEAAGRGARVVLIDARREIGGRARTRTRDGYALNEGAHALYVDGAAMAFVRSLGCEPSGGVPDAGAGIGIDGALEGAFPVGATSLLRTRLLAGDRLAMGKLLLRLPRMRTGDVADRSVDALVRELLGTGRAARLALALFRLSTYSNDPMTTSADAGIAQLQLSVGSGVRYLDGGWQTMVGDLEKACIDRRVEIRTGVKVASIGAEAGEYAVVAPGGQLRARRVIVAGSPDLATRLLGSMSPAARAWAEAARPAAVASLDIGFPDEWGGPPPFVLGIDTPTYLSVHAPVADLAPKGHTLVHVMRYLPGNEPPDSERDRTECEALLARVRPDWRGEADFVSFRPRLLAATDQPTVERGGLAGRPAVAVPGAAGVFIAGDWVGPDGLLVDASVASGRAAGSAAGR